MRITSLLYTFLLSSIPLYASSEVYNGEFIKLSSHSLSNPIYALKVRSNRIYHLIFDESPVDIITGDRGYVEGDLIKDNDIYVNAIKVINYNINEPAARVKDYTTLYNVTSITFVLNVCNWTNYEMSKFTSKWTRATSGNNAVNMQNYFDSCTYNRFTFTDDNNIVVGPINVPCSSNDTRFLKFNSSNCGLLEIYGWAEYAQHYAVTVLNISLTKYRHRMLMLPNGVPCGWAGLGTLGCGPSCFTWYNGVYGTELNVVMHELGHNFGLHHSSTLNEEYGDGSCIMGGCCGNRCYNIPQSWVLSLTQPVNTYNATSLGTGVWISNTVPAHLVSDKNFIKIDVDWVDTTTSYFVSYRAPVKYDQYLLAHYLNKVFVHRFIRVKAENARPFLQAILTPSTNFTITDPGVGVVVKFISSSNQSATVSICRKSTPSIEICDDGIDNDCNGLIDYQDPGCKVPFPPSPPPKPPPPPLKPSPPPPPPPKPSPPPPPPSPSPPKPSPLSARHPPPPPLSSPPPIPPSPPSSSIKRYVSVKVPLKVNNTYIFGELCQSMASAIKALDYDVVTGNDPCTISASTTAKYMNVYFTSSIQSISNIKNRLQLTLQQFTINAKLFCTAVITFYESVTSNRILFRYASHPISCID